MANVVVRKSGSHTNWEFANHIIYPFWQPGTFSMGKTFESYIVNARDDSLAHINDGVIDDYRRGVIKTLLLAKEMSIA